MFCFMVTSKNKAAFCIWLAVPLPSMTHLSGSSALQLPLHGGSACLVLHQVVWRWHNTSSLPVKHTLKSDPLWMLGLLHMRLSRNTFSAPYMKHVTSYFSFIILNKQHQKLKPSLSYCLFFFFIMKFVQSFFYIIHHSTIHSISNSQLMDGPINTERGGFLHIFGVKCHTENSSGQNGVFLSP